MNNMEDDAIQKKDVSEDGQQESGEARQQQAQQFTSPRDELIEAIATRLENERNRELGIVDEEAPKDGDAEASKTDEDSAGVEEQEPKGPSEEEMVEVVVDGRKQSVPVSQVIETGKRALQKDLAADARLEEASRLLREAKGREARAEQERREAEPVPDQKDAGPAGGDSEKITAWAKAIQYGDENEAKAAISEILSVSKSQVPTFSLEMVARAVDQRLARLSIVQKFETEFSDLASDPYLARMVAHKADELLTTGEPNNWELYRKAGESVREWRDKIVGAAKPVNDELEQRREKKRELDVVKSANARAVPTQKEPRPQTPSEIVMEMRKARGQAV